MKDLVILVADKSMPYALRGALARPEALGIRTMTFDFRTHMGRDGGARTTGAEMLALITSRISLRRCSDPAFLRLRTALKAWFALEQ